ncbi:sensor histidine kinase [Actinoplanes aureus]|uniref:Sensor histidine kinase n=1 Tax=Actinoplanes aureus TaxID=2792083 RepID=A0A931C7Q0_9ACTN|nr:sensor histidine kinase [Actinoplanes aureus]MBG0562476.1 sensor histidine kinase [Actinoplanes aureus]
MMSSRSRASRVDWYLRGSMFVLYLAVPLAIGGSLGSALGPVALIGVGFGTAQAIAAALLLNAALEYRLGRGARPTRLLVTVVVLSVLTVGAGWPGYDEVEPAFAFIVTVMLTSLLSAVAPMVSTTAVTSLSFAGWLVAAAPAIWRDGDEFFPQLGLLIVIGVGVSTSRTTAWMLDLVWQLDDAQNVRADLAVAEERLRFARDLHDVAGRALSVVALKAELAAKLGSRGRPEAVDEMLEVRRIAQESMAELRAVVSGLRTAQLGEELAGARSLLAAAGITCRVIGEAGGLGPRTETALGWAVREATTNVLRHSEARECTIELDRAADGTVSLIMRNDGATGGRARHGNGLTGLTERITAVGGTVTADREPPDRFRVEVRLPAAAELPEVAHP